MTDTPGRDRNLADTDPSILPPPLPDVDFHIPDQPLAENEPDPGRPVIRTVPHPDPLSPHGTLIVCPTCAADRDWLLLNFAEQVFVRCRCAHEWLEPGLSRADFDGFFSHTERVFPDFESAMTSMGYDGLLAGLYLN